MVVINSHNFGPTLVIISYTKPIKASAMPGNSATIEGINSVAIQKAIAAQILANSITRSPIIGNTQPTKAVAHSKSCATMSGVTSNIHLITSANTPGKASRRSAAAGTTQSINAWPHSFNLSPIIDNCFPTQVTSLLTKTSNSPNSGGMIGPI